MVRKPINADYSALTEKIDTNSEGPKLKLMIESELLSIKILLLKVTLKISQEKYLLSLLCWELILRPIKLKI